MKLIRLIPFAAVITACSSSLFDNPANYRTWNSDQFKSFGTFSNTPLGRFCGDPNDLRCARYFRSGKLGSEKSARQTIHEIKSGHVASSAIPWRIDPKCRNDADSYRAKTRLEILKRCAESGRYNDENFITLSITGGGTKSALFSTEAMFALQAWGLMEQVDAVSSVSGGSFTAALYGLSCDDRADIPNIKVCPTLQSGDFRWRWRYPDVIKKVQKSFVWRQLMQRAMPFGILARLTTHRNTSATLSEVFRDTVLDVSDARFADLNPMRPNVIINATNMTTDRRHVLRHLMQNNGYGIRERVITPDSSSHFAFTDYYFEKLLSSDISQYPVATAVAASAAFPLIIDTVTLGRFKPDNEPCLPEGLLFDPRYPRNESENGKVEVCDYVHLLDGGIRDNHGITEIDLAIREITKQGAKPQPRRVLSILLDSSLVPVTGISQKIPSPRDIDSFFSPLRPLGVSKAYDITLAVNGLQRKSRLQTLFDELKAKEQIDAHIADVSILGLDSSECGENRSERCNAIRELTDPGNSARREAFGLGIQHPQCIFEAARHAETSYSIDDDIAVCLRHAARWAVAIEMTAMCKSATWRELIPGCNGGEYPKLPADYEKLTNCNVAKIVAEVTQLAPMDQPYWYSVVGATDPQVCTLASKEQRWNDDARDFIGDREPPSRPNLISRTR